MSIFGRKQPSRGKTEEGRVIHETLRLKKAGKEEEAAEYLWQQPRKVITRVHMILARIHPRNSNEKWVQDEAESEEVLNTKRQAQEKERQAHLDRASKIIEQIRNRLRKR